MLVYIIEILFTTYTFLLLARVLGSWFPQFSRSKVMAFVSLYTDPYLNFFRNLVPPIGMLDISPMVALFALQIIQWLLFTLIH
jgi:YggT family protein